MKKYYSADIINGVCLYGNDKPEADIITPDDFYNSLPNVKDQTIFTHMDDQSEIYEKISTEYGIH